MTRFGIVAAAALALLMLSNASSALAAHEHFLVTPGTCVEDIGSGQTAISDSLHGGYHQFHGNVHIGQPGGSNLQTNTGTVGPLNRDGVAPVIVDKTSGGNPDNLAACLAAGS